MKRALLLAVLLAAALALVWLYTRRGGNPGVAPLSQEFAASSAPPTDTSARMESEQAAPALDQELGAAPTRIEQTTARSAKLPAPPGPTAAVRGRVVRARTQVPVQAGEARIMFVLPGEEQTTPGELDPRRVRRSTGVGKPQVTFVPPDEEQFARQQIDVSDVRSSAKLDEQGRFQFEFPIGTRLAQLTVTPLVPVDDGLARDGSDPPILFAASLQSLNQRLGNAGVDLLVEVEDSIELVGLVCDIDTRAPLEGVSIHLDASAFVPAAHSGPDGRFKLIGIPLRERPPRWSVRAERADHLPRLVPLVAEQLASGAEPLLIELTRGLAIAGSVVDLRGVPVRGATLNFRTVGFDPGVDLSASVFSTRTDDRGEFRCAHAPPCSSLSVELQAQHSDGRDLLPLRRDLGPLRADRTDLQIEVQSSGILEVHAQLADGTPLGSREFQVLCTDVPGVESVGSSDAGVSLRVPFGVDLTLEAYASARAHKLPPGFLRGRQTLRVESREPSPRVVLLVLAEHSDYSAPPPRDGVRELSLPEESFVHAAVDVQLLDAASGRPIGPGTRVSISGAGTSLMTSTLKDGWLRIHGRPGSHEFEVDIDGGTHELMHVVIPASGYGTAEWRLGQTR